MTCTTTKKGYGYVCNKNETRNEILLLKPAVDLGVSFRQFVFSSTICVWPTAVARSWRVLLWAHKPDRLFMPCVCFQIAINAAPKPSNPYARKLNQRRKPWCIRKTCRRYRNGSEEPRSDNAVCATGCLKGIMLCRNRVRREANKG